MRSRASDPPSGPLRSLNEVINECCSAGLIGSVTAARRLLSPERAEMRLCEGGRGLQQSLFLFGLTPSPRCAISPSACRSLRATTVPLVCQRPSPEPGRTVSESASPRRPLRRFWFGSRANQKCSSSPAASCPPHGPEEPRDAPEPR